MNTYYIVNNAKKRYDPENKLRTCEVASKLRLYHGRIYSEDDIRKAWTYDLPYPSLDKIRQIVSVKNIKWYINTHTDALIIDPQWNADFLMGMLQWGQIHYNPVFFPSFRWYGNPDLLLAIIHSPFAGRMINGGHQPKRRLIWSDVPALCLKFSTDSVEYMAGVLSTGIIEASKNKVLVKYNRNVAKILESWKIPCEHKNKQWFYISPFWPVILQNYMPDILKEKWEFVPKAYRAQEYSSILWKIYTGKDPVADKMPYILSRRMIFYKYGSMKKMRDLWIENHLVELDIRFKKVVQDWQAIAV